MSKIMLDLETLSARPDAAIIAIGAVHFDVDGVSGDPFYCLVKPESAAQYGRIDASTFVWWTQQSEEARAVFSANAQIEAVDLELALVRFVDYVHRWKAKDKTEMWGNGADFDNVILGHAFDTAGVVGNCGHRKPWSFTRNRCYRTLKSLFHQNQIDQWADKHRGEYVKHNAMDDAVFQAKMAVEMLQRTYK